MQRAGRKKLPFYHIVVAEKSRSVKGRFIEKLGYYSPLSDPKDIKLNTERIEHWVSVGAAPSQTVARLGSKNGVRVFEKFIKERVMKPSKAEQKAAEEAAAKKAEEEAAAAAQKESDQEASEQKEEASAPEANTASEDAPDTPEESKEESKPADEPKKEE